MSVDITIKGSALSPEGRQYWALEASSTEDATGLELTDTFGGVGSLEITTEMLDDALLMQGERITAKFDDGGERAGTIKSIAAADGRTVTFSADSPLARLNRTITARPTATNLGEMLGMIFERCGIADYAIEYSIANTPALTAGWNGNAWQKLKECAAVYGFEIADDGGELTVRRVGNIKSDIAAASMLTETVAEGSLGLKVETHLYNYRQISRELVYPPARYNQETGTSVRARWEDTADIVSISPGTPNVFEVPLLASLSSVDQPECKKWVNIDHAGSSVYTVMRSGGKETVDPAVWTGRGGSVKVEILQDTQTLRITVDAGRNSMSGAPYRLAMSSGRGDYSTLRIVGTGVAWDKTRLRMTTSVPGSLTDNEIASSTDSMFVRSHQQAITSLIEQATSASRAVSTLTATLPSMNVPLGRRAGAIVRGTHQNYRVRTATTNSSSVVIEAAARTTIAEHNAAMAGMTIADVNAMWAGQRLRSHNLTPLGRGL